MFYCVPRGEGRWLNFPPRDGATSRVKSLDKVWCEQKRVRIHLKFHRWICLSSFFILPHTLFLPRSPVFSLSFIFFSFSFHAELILSSVFLNTFVLSTSIFFSFSFFHSNFGKREMKMARENGSKNLSFFCFIFCYLSPPVFLFPFTFPSIKFEIPPTRNRGNPILL